MAINEMSVGGSLGAALGQGLSQGIGRLAEIKLNDLYQNKQRSRNEKLFRDLGFTPDQSAVFSQLDPKTQQYVIGDYLQKGGASLIGQQGSPYQQQTSAPDFQSMQQQIAQPQSLDQMMNGMSLPAPTSAQMLQALGRQQQIPLPMEELLGALAQGQQFQPQQMMQPQEQEAPLQQQFGQTPAGQGNLAAQAIGVNSEPQKRVTAADILSQPNQKQRQQLQKQALEEQKAVDKRTEKYYQESLKADESARANDMRLTKMENLIKKGNLPFASFYNFFKRLEEDVPPTYAGGAGAGIGAYVGGPLGAVIGGAIGGLISPVASMIRSGQRFLRSDTEQFEKLSNDFVRDAKNIFGSRVTDQDLKVFMSMVPTLSQTDNGKKAIIRNMKSFNEGIHVRAKVMKDIIKENGGKRPDNLQIIVEERAKPQLDRIADKFETGEQ